MKDNNDPEILGNAILRYKELYGCTITEAADQVYEAAQREGGVLVTGEALWGVEHSAGALSRASRNGRGEGR